MKEFLDAITGPLGPGRLLELRIFAGEGRPIQIFTDRVETVESYVQEYGPTRDIYFGVLPRSRMEGGGSAIEDVTSVLWADFDAKGLGGKEGAFAALASIAPQPQIIVDSGNGYHGYWLLREEIEYLEARQVMQGFMIEAGADKTFDKARILRVPGTLNHKSDPPLPVRILRFDLLSRRHRISDFVDYASAAMPVRQPITAREYGDWINQTEGWNRSKLDANKFPEGTRNNSLAAIAGIMYARGMAEEQVVEELLWENDVRCDPPLDQSEVETIASSIGRLHG